SRGSSGRCAGARRDGDAGRHRKHHRFRHAARDLSPRVRCGALAALGAQPDSRGSCPAMLIGLWIRDVVLIEALDLSIGPGLTALTGETGAGKSIILDALGLATGARADAGLVRRGANQAAASAVVAPAPERPFGGVME